MLQLQLKRYGSIPGVGTFGVLHVGQLQLCTVEREWLDNMGFKSCIPTGRYELVPYHSEEYPDHYALSNPALGVYVSEAAIPKGVVGRYAILIHVANLPSEVVGCIAVGTEFGYPEVHGKLGLGVLKSGMAYKMLKDRLDSFNQVFIDVGEQPMTW